MTDKELGFLLLTSQLGNPRRRPLTVAQLRNLAGRVRSMERSEENRQMVPDDLVRLGYFNEEARHILALLEDRELLEYYLYKGRRAGCVPLIRAGVDYPGIVRRRLGDDSPGCLWAKGDPSVLNSPAVALVGSRDLGKENRLFAENVGIQAAQAGFTLVSGNARGADLTAQQACLQAGGKVICVVADSLERHPLHPKVLYLSEDSYDAPFSTQRALSRNRVIHALGRLVFVAQANYGRGGTWDGTVRNLKAGWSNVYCFQDGSRAVEELTRLGAVPIGISALLSIQSLYQQNNRDSFPADT